MPEFFRTESCPSTPTPTQLSVQLPCSVGLTDICAALWLEPRAAWFCASSRPGLGHGPSAWLLCPFPAPAPRGLPVCSLRTSLPSGTQGAPGNPCVSPAPPRISVSPGVWFPLLQNRVRTTPGPWVCCWACFSKAPADRARRFGASVCPPSPHGSSRQGSPEKRQLDAHIKGPLLWEMPHVITEAEKFQDPPSSSWRPKTCVWRSENQGSRGHRSQSKGRR